MTLDLRARMRVSLYLRLADLILFAARVAVTRGIAPVGALAWALHVANRLARAALGTFRRQECRRLEKLFGLQRSSRT